MAKKISKPKKTKSDISSKDRNEKILNDPICAKWLSFCYGHDQESPLSFIKEKSDFYHQNMVHLKSKGFLFENSESTQRSLDYLKTEVLDDLEGCLLHIKVGNEHCVPSEEEQTAITNSLAEFVKDKKGITVLITDHTIEIQKFNLPQLRRITSKVISSNDPENTSNILNQVEI